MKWASGSPAKQEATVPAGVCRVILDNFSLFNHEPDITPPNHSVGPKHLLQCMRQEKDPFPPGLPDVCQNVGLMLHMGSVQLLEHPFNGVFF